MERRDGTIKAYYVRYNRDMGTLLPDDTAHHRFRKRHGRRWLIGLVVSVSLHAVLFFALPVIPSSRQHTPTPELQVVSLPSEVVEAPPRVVIPEPAIPVPEPSPPQPDPPNDDPGSIPPPQVIPHDVPPRLINRAEVERTLLDLYPGSLEVMKVGGAVTLWLYVNDRGEVIRVVVREPSQFQALNRAARVVARAMRFRPAEQAGQTVAVWVQQRIRFQTHDTTGAATGRKPGANDPPR